MPLSTPCLAANKELCREVDNKEKKVNDGTYGFHSVFPGKK
jgi:hypothetical protein